MLKTWEGYLLSDATAHFRQTAVRVSLKVHVVTQMCMSISVLCACYRIRMFECFFFKTLYECLSVQSEMKKKQTSSQWS